MIAIEVSDSMRSNDLQPTRLDRARFKILDLVEARSSARTALIAYSGSAHIVLPPTKDAAIVKPFLEGLDPAIMPAAGANAASVLPLAGKLLGDEAAAATLLFVNDGFETVDIPAVAEFARAPGAPGVAALVLGTAQGGVALMPDGSFAKSADGARIDTRVDEPAVRRFRREAGAAVVRAGSGDADIRQLLRHIESRVESAGADDPNLRWRDQGWWFLWPAVVATAAWFRRGWTMKW